MLPKAEQQQLTFDHLLFLRFDDWVVHGLGQRVVNDGLDHAQTLLVAHAVLLAHPVHDVPVDFGDRTVHLSFKSAADS